MGAVEGVLAVADAAPDQQPVRAAALGHCGVGGLDQDPVVPAGTFGAGPGRHPLPGPRRQQPGQLDRRARADPGDDQVTLGDGQDEAEPAAGQLGAQRRILAVDLIGGHPRRGRPGIQRPGDHLPGQRRLGGERRVLRDPRGPAPGRIACPGPGQVQRPVDERGPGCGGIGQVHRNLGVLGPPGGAGVLPLGAHGGAPFQVASFIHDQDRRDQRSAPARSRAGHPASRRHPTPRPTAAAASHGMLVPGMLSDRPAVHPGQPGQQAAHEPRHPPPRLDPGEPPAHLAVALESLPRKRIRPG